MIKHTISMQALRNAYEHAPPGKTFSTPHWVFIEEFQRSVRESDYQTDKNVNIDATAEMDVVVFSTRLTFHPLVRFPKEVGELYVGGVHSMNPIRPSRLYAGVVAKGDYPVCLYAGPPVKGTASTALSAKIDGAVGKMLDSLPTFDDRVVRLQGLPLDKSAYNELLFRAARLCIVPSKRLSFLEKAYTDCETAWSLLLKVSHATPKKQVFKKPRKDKMQLLCEFCALLSQVEVVV